MSQQTHFWNKIFTKFLVIFDAIDSEIMYPKNTNDLGYHVTLYPKSNTNCDGHSNPMQTAGSLSQSYTRSPSMTEQDKRYCNDDIHTVLSASGRKGIQSSKTSSFHNGQLMGSKLEMDSQSYGSSQTNQVLYQKCLETQPQSMQEKPPQNKPKQETIHPTELSSNALHSIRNLQNSSADCFNLIFENVLKAANGIVEQMVKKYFQSIISRMNFLHAELSRQEQLLGQLKTDVTRSKLFYTTLSISYLVSFF